MSAIGRNSRSNVPSVFVAVLFFLLAGAVFPRKAQAAFGTSPPFLNADHLVKGATYSQTVYLVQDQPAENLPVHAALDIPDSIRSWVTLDSGFDFAIPKGTHQFPVVIVVKVPPDTGLGVYRGNLTFTTAPSKTGQITIALGAQVAINLTVGSGIWESFTVPLIRLLDIEEGWDPRVYVKFNNQGNVPEAFTGATYELMDQFSAVRLAYIQKTSGFPETLPFTTNEYTIDFPVKFHLGTGQYWGTVSFYQNDKLVASQKTVFNVLKAGSLSTPSERALRTFQKNYPSLIVAAALVGSAVFAYRLRRRRPAA